MGDKNTHIKREQVEPLRIDDIDAINEPSAGQVPAMASGGQFEWVDMGGGTPPVYSKSFIITNPTSSADSPIWRTSVAITITAIHVLCIGGTNIIGMLDEFDANGANPVSVDDSDITGTAGTNVNDDGTLNNAIIDAGDYIGWHTTSVSGEVTKVIITFEYTIN